MASELNTSWYNYPTNYSGNNTVDGPYEMFVGFPSFILNNTFAAGVVLLVWIATFSLSLVSGTKKALAVASFITLILSVYLMKYLNPVIFIVLIFLIIIGVIGSKEDAY